jgi:hypothetical protein
MTVVYQNFTHLRHKEVLCLTSDTQEVGVYHFFDFVLHKKVVLRLNQQVELKANGYPVLVLNVFM